MEPVEYTYYEETADDDDDSANEAEVPPNQESSASSRSPSEYSSSSSSEEHNDESDQDEDGNQEDEQETQAPSFAVPSRTIAAVEHPFLVMNVDKGLETFGNNPQYDSVMIRLLLLDIV